MRYAFITEDVYPWNGRLIPGGCAYYRLKLPMNVVKHNAVFGPPAWTAETGFGVVLHDSKAVFGFDVVVMKMLMARWIPMQMQRAKELGQRIIVDMDDAFDHLHEDNLAYHTTDPKQNKVNNREHLWSVLREADLVTVSTPFLFDYYSGHLPNVVMVRNAINPTQFQPRKHTTRKPIIGWVGAMGWRSNDIETLQDWFPDFVEQHDLTVFHGGYEPQYRSFADASGVKPERVIEYPMLPLTEYHEFFHHFDIGIVPLSFIPFNEAKSNIKGLEYASGNIPFVAAATGEYRWLETQGIGRTSATPEEWVHHLTELLDYRTRKREAAVQRTLALTEQSITARAHEWAEVFGRYANHTTAIKGNVMGYVYS